jgi:4-hydroxy-3-methylbut-2-enyl diphosphate reductase
VKVLLANPRGFCAGVDRAIDIVERAIELFGAPIYVRHEVVHNKFVVDRLRGLGAVFVEELDAVPDGATVIFSAHGVSSAVEQEAARSMRPARSSPRSTWKSASTPAMAST